MNPNKRIMKLRRQIDAVDRRIIHDVRERLKLAGLIGQEKQRRGLSIIDPQREADVISNIEKQATRKKVSVVFIKSLFRLLINESRKEQHGG